jgi:hypothetical protein
MARNADPQYHETICLSEQCIRYHVNVNESKRSRKVWNGLICLRIISCVCCEHCNELSVSIQGGKFLE